MNLSKVIIVIHLLIFILLTFMLVSFPAISSSKKRNLSFQIDPQLLKKIRSVELKKMVSNVIGLMYLFEHMFENSIVAHFLWISGFISWILGCCYWVLEVEVLSIIFISGSIVLSLIAIFSTLNILIIHFTFPKI